MITGLSRSIRSETLLRFSTLDLDLEHMLSEDDTAKAILKVFVATFSPEAEANREFEYMERNGAFFTPRIINDAKMNEYVHKQTKASVLEPTEFIQDGRPLQMAIGMPGVLESLYFVDQSISEPLPDDEIEIEVKAIGMNYREVASAMGHLETSSFGFECSGIVTRAGCNAATFAIGNRVACVSIPYGVYSTYARTKAAFAFKINNDITFERGSCFYSCGILHRSLRLN